MPSFVPRLDIRHKPYRHVVTLGETPQKIAEKHGAGPRGYAELLAANLPRRTRPMGVGSPSGSVTFWGLLEGERLNVPSHWPERGAARALSGVSAPANTLGAAPVMDTSNPLFVAASDSAHKQFDEMLKGEEPEDASAYLSSVLNAAIQWYVNQTSGGSPTIDLPLMDRLVYNAGIWSETFGSAIQDQAGKLAWGPLGMLLSSTPIAWDTVDFGGSGLPASPPAPTAPADMKLTLVVPPGFPTNADWSWVPWDLIAANGTALETLPPLVPVDLGNQLIDQAGIRAKFDAAIQEALSGPPPGCEDGYKQKDPADASQGCVSICANAASWDPVNKLCCPTSYNAAKKTCDCIGSAAYDPATNTCTTTAIEPKKDDTKPEEKKGIGAGTVIGILAGGTALYFGGRYVMKNMKKTSTA